MTLTAKDVTEIMRLLESSSFDSLSLEINGVRLKLQRSSTGVGQIPTVVPVPQAVSESKPSVQPPAPRKSAPPSEPGLAEVASPLLGIFYRAPKPGEPPFVEIGAKVEQDTVIGIIEVMKLMNTVRAGVRGEIAQILAENGALVEYGEILMRVRPKA